MRSQARESVYKYLYSRLFNPQDEGLFTVLQKELNEADKTFANELLFCVDKNYDAYIEKMGEISQNYTFKRIIATDKCAILIGMAELDNYLDTDVPVIINEAVNLSAKFSTEKSTDFVNGILAEYAKLINRR